MNCPYCKTPLLGEMKVCPKCKFDTSTPDGGDAHQQWLKDTQSKGKTIGTIDGDKNGEKEYGVGWLKFYINWRFPIAFILGALSLFSSFGSIFIYSTNVSGVLYAFLAWDIFIYVYRIPVYANMKKMNSLGYSLNVGLIVAESVELALRSALRQVLRGDTFLSSFLVALPLAFLIWFLPNYIYFKHRKYMFVSDASVMPKTTTETNAPMQVFLSQQEDSPRGGTKGLSAKEGYKPTDDAILFCRYCGSRIEINSKFCRSCGKQLISAGSEEIEIQRETEQKEKTPFVFPLSKLPPKLHRAFLFIEDAEWDRADQYLEAVLDEDPTNAYAYVGKLMVDLRIKQTSDLQLRADEVKGNKYFVKALRYSSDELKKLLATL